jgi:hypothetical protein
MVRKKVLSQIAIFILLDVGKTERLCCKDAADLVHLGFF